MMACSLCYETKGRMFDFDGDKAMQLQIVQILFKYFPFCFNNEEQKNGCICRKCWYRVDAFHQFYTRIEEVQKNYNRHEIIEESKCDTTLEDTKELIIAEDPEFIANNDNQDDNNVTEEFDSISFNDGFFDANDDDDDDDDNNELNMPEIKEEIDKPTKTNNAPRTAKKKQKNKQKPIKCKPKCEHCEQTFMSGRKLRKHLIEQHSEFQLRCHHSDCEETFTTAEELEKHKERHVKVPCPRCGRMIQANNLKKHIRHTHEIDQRVVCDLCGRVSSTIVMHKYHVRSDHEVHERLQCDICKEWYKNKENLRSHMRSIHVEGPQKCTICGRISTNMKALSKHKKIHLEGSKERFKCIVCGKGFRDRTKLKEHSYIHTGVTDAYVCQFCGKAFRFV
ncbi:zinc finger protein 729-like isoform X2 [Contarinia nasturtii]|uniref:zinc finger protein 729-like isoform X2 n=1 Tax=Contarinia nasturtii TaxID=265458 RepID=UPI0012D47C74|nr:zinc finger protein 729-like isoform X2 [Contarinia nasturtii]